MRLAFILFMGCGRVAFDPLDDATTPGVDCWPAWRAGTPAFTNIAPIAALAHPDKDGNPWLAGDGKTLFWDNGTGDTELYFATRAGPGQPFGARTQIGTLTSPLEETGLVMTADERIGVFASTRTGSNGFDLWEVRQDVGVFNAPTQTAYAAINDGFNQVDGFLSTDGKRIYFANGTGPGQVLRMASRASTTGVFGAPTAIPGTGTFAIEADPDLSLDELVLVFSAGGPLQLYFATRDSTTSEFRPPVKLTALAGGGHEGDPALSANGCELFFISDRSGANRELFHADVSPL